TPSCPGSSWATPWPPSWWGASPGPRRPPGGTPSWSAPTWPSGPGRARGRCGRPSSTPWSSWTARSWSTTGWSGPASWPTWGWAGASWCCRRPCRPGGRRRGGGRSAVPVWGGSRSAIRLLWGGTSSCAAATSSTAPTGSGSRATRDSAACARPWPASRPHRRSGRGPPSAAPGTGRLRLLRHRDGEAGEGGLLGDLEAGLAAALVQGGPGVDHVAPGQLVPLGQGGEAGGHRLQRRVGLRVGLVEDQEVAAGLQRPRHRGERRRLQGRGDLVDDQEAGGDVVGALLADLVDAVGPGLATAGQAPLLDQPPGQLDRVGLDVDPDTGGPGEPLGDLHQRPAAATAHVQPPAPPPQPRAQAGQPRQHQVQEDAGERLQPLGDLPHERLAVL